jgi:glycosyltransferase involved in cell wall biosynthesis
MANGAAVIGTRRAGLPEHLADAGVWVDPNGPNGLAAAIARLLRDEAERRRVAEAGRARAERDLSWDAIARKTLAVYEKAVQFKHRNAAS